MFVFAIEAGKDVSGGYETVSAQDLEQIGQLARASKGFREGNDEGSNSLTSPLEK